MLACVRRQMKKPRRDSAEGLWVIPPIRISAANPAPGTKTQPIVEAFYPVPGALLIDPHTVYPLMN